MVQVLLLAATLVLVLVPSLLLVLFLAPVLLVLPASAVTVAAQTASHRRRSISFCCDLRTLMFSASEFCGSSTSSLNNWVRIGWPQPSPVMQ